jgi:hypothetical protein
VSDDAQSIERLIRAWALWRDTRQWDQLRTCYWPGARVRTTWMEGTSEEFIEASIRSASNPNAPLAQHALGGTIVKVNGDRALAETRMTLLLRAQVDGVEVDITAWGRFIDRLVCAQGEWRIVQRDPIHEKDRLDPVDPQASLKLDSSRLATLPRAYRHIAYVQSQGGARITPDLIEHNSPAQQALYEACTTWLNCRQR